MSILQHVSSRFPSLEYLQQNIEHAADSDKNAALAMAVRRNNEEIVQFLLEHGSDPDTSTLLFAYEHRFIQIVKLLIIAGAIVDTTYARTLTDVVQQARTRLDREMTDALVEAGVDRLAALSVALQSPMRGHLHTYVTADASLGFEGSVINATNAEKDLALAYAVHYKKTDMVRVLLDNGAYADGAQLRHAYDSPNLRLQDQDNADVPRVLHEAYDNRDFAIIGLLLSANASLRYYYLGPQGHRDMTIPMHVIVNRDQAMLELFVDRGWSVNEREPARGHFTPLMTAILRPPLFGDRGRIIQYLVNEGANTDMQSFLGGKITHIHQCIGNRTALRVLLTKGVAINVYDKTGKTPLACAISNFTSLAANNPDAFNELDDELDDDDHDELDDELHDELDDELRRRRGIIKDILRYNVDFEYPDSQTTELPPLAATIKKLVDTYRTRQDVAYLETLQQVDAQDQWGKTALHRACENGQLDAVKLLVAGKRANRNIRDNWGNTAYDAMKHRYQQERAFLENRDNFYIPGTDTFRYIDGDHVARSKLLQFIEIGSYLAELDVFERDGPQIIPIHGVFWNLVTYLFS